MRSIADVFAQLEAAVQAIGALDWDALPVTELLENLDRLETARRQAMACAYDGAAAVDRRDEQALGGRSHQIIADVLRVSPGEARRRLVSGAQLAPRDRKSTRLNSSHIQKSRMPSSA